MRVPHKRPLIWRSRTRPKAERLFSGHLSGAAFLPRAATTLMGSKSQIRTMTDKIEARAWPKLQKAPDPVS